MRKRTHAREFALQILYHYEMNPHPAKELFQLFWQENDEQDAEIRAFAERIAEGTIEHLSELDEMISRYTNNWQLNRMAAVDRNVLRFSVYEILYMNDIPPKVTINEAVNIAKKFSQIDSGKFVNGVLDKINHTERPEKTAQFE